MTLIWHRWYDSDMIWHWFDTNLTLICHWLDIDMRCWIWRMLCSGGDRLFQKHPNHSGGNEKDKGSRYICPKKVFSLKKDPGEATGGHLCLVYWPLIQARTCQTLFYKTFSRESSSFFQSNWKVLLFKSIYRARVALHIVRFPNPLGTGSWGNLTTLHISHFYLCVTVCAWTGKCVGRPKADGGVSGERGQLLTNC